MSQAELARMIRIATMGELAASIAHEINQPLGAVVANGSAALRWLAGQPSNLEEAREAIERTIREAKRASDVIERIRDLLQKTQPRMERLDVNAVIREVRTLSANELERGSVTLQTELAADVPPVLGDRVQLQQVLLNLILNGIDAMSTITDRPRELLIKSAKHPDGVLIQVHDSGKGVDPEQADRIFESFFTTKPEGIGMGLSISRSIVEAHGGRLWFTPEPTRSDFSIHSAQGRWSFMTEQPPIVFVIDDDASIRDALKSLIRSVGLKVELFGSPREFLQPKRPDVPSCLVLDVRLPGESGLDFQRELAAANIHIPIIFVTGHGDIPMSVRAMKAGAVEFLDQAVSRSGSAGCDSKRTGEGPGQTRTRGRNCGVAGALRIADRAGARSRRHGRLAACSTSRLRRSLAPQKTP